MEVFLAFSFLPPEMHFDNIREKATMLCHFALVRAKKKHLEKSDRLLASVTVAYMGRMKKQYVIYGD